tara:strand:- start:1131 stop:1325 length:195 start_codon:yes stop_codon:yes gene_type:complete
MPFTKVEPIYLSKCCNKPRDTCYDPKDNVCSHCLNKANFEKVNKEYAKKVREIEYCEWLLNNKI